MLDNLFPLLGLERPHLQSRKTKNLNGEKKKNIYKEKDSIWFFLKYYITKFFFFFLQFVFGVTIQIGITLEISFQLIS